MKELNENDIDEIEVDKAEADNKGADKADANNNVEGNATANKKEDIFDITPLAKYGEKSLEQLERHARINAGFHDYEEDTFADKQMIGNLCDQYRVFFEENPVFNSFIKEMKEYALLDPYTHENYVKERDFVSSIPKKLEELNKALDIEEEELQKELNEIDEEAFKKLPEDERKKIDRKYVLMQETIDNRRRALASFDMYFENMSRGEMKDIDELKKQSYFMKQSDDEIKLGLKKTKVDLKLNIEYADGLDGRTAICLNDEDGNEFYYINSHKVKLDLNIDREGLNSFQKTLVTLADTTSKEIEIPDAPIFPHEPMMTDVSQRVSGECYLYAGLQNVARMYPQKIKEMIKDNGDGTATVRLYGKKFNKETRTTEFVPVYVRVDKVISKFGAAGIQYERMGEDCLWVNLIERAYAMSGLHETRGENDNLPIMAGRTKGFENWKPSVRGIEGGLEEQFLENLLGPDGVSHFIDKPSLYNVQEERKKLEEAKEKLEQIKDVDVNDPESIVKHALYSYSKSSPGDRIGDMSEKEFQKLTKDEVVSKVDDFFVNLGYQAAGEYMEYIYDGLVKMVTTILSYPPEKRNTKDLGNSLANIRDNAIEEVAKDNDLTGNEFDGFERGMIGVYERLRERIFDMGLEHQIPKREKTEKFFNEVKTAIDKGLLVSCSTYNKAEKTKLADEQHAYSLIGAYASDDVPPKYYFRIKNPHTKLTSDNGVEYTNEDGKVVGKWVNVKDGIFDMEMEDFLNDFERIHYNGDKVLESIPQKKIVGYDIITPAEVDKHEKSIVTNDKLTDYMKSANDLYDALICTNSKYSHDSDQYKDLVEGLKQFRHKLAGAQGRNIADMEKLTEPLMNLVGAYEKHVDDKIMGPSKRQSRRKKVCSEIRKVVTAIKEGRNPHQEYEKEYAKTLIDKYYDMNNIKDKSEIDAVADRLYNNKAFRGIANNTNIFSMKNPAKNQVETHLKKIETSLKGRGIDKGVDLATMKATKDPRKMTKTNKTVKKEEKKEHVGAKKG